MKTKQKITIYLLMILFILMPITPVYAMYQSIYNSRGQYSPAYPDSWLKNIRRMEEEGKGMGLNEELKDDGSLTSTISNDIDVHMIKNTEYGAIALLSASPEYGKQGSGNSRYVRNGTGLSTTTGNVYGIYFNSDGYNYVASIGKEYYGNRKEAQKYLDIYDSEYGPAKAGDAVLNWHGNTNSYFPYSTYFTYRNYSSYGIFYSSRNNGSKYSRAVAVCGSGF